MNKRLGSLDLRTLILLITCNLIWSASPVLSKIVLRDFDTSEAAWLRYVSAFMAYVAFAFILWMRGRPDAVKADFFAAPRTKLDWLFLPLMGILTFCISPVLQMAGISASRAIDGALIIAMEPMLAILLAWVFLREQLRLVQAISFLIAVFGFALLAELQPFHMVWGGRTIGNLILLLSIVGEAAYSVLGKSLMSRHSAVSIFGTALGFGVLLLCAFTWSWTGSMTPDFSKLTANSALAVLWLGPVATTAGYLYWMTALRHAPVAAVVLTLFVQPVFGSLWGLFLLGERLTVPQALGAALILAAVFGKPLFSMMRQLIQKEVMERSRGVLK